MIIPIGHEETSLRRLPVVTFTIMGACVVALLAIGDEGAERWGLIPEHFNVPSLFTHMFLHTGAMHLLGNMLLLYLLGPYVEDVWGRPLYALFYLLSCAVAAGAFISVQPHLDVPLVGASGAIAGVMGAFLVRYGRTRIRLGYLLTLRLRGTFDAPAWVVLPIWFAEQLIMAALKTMDADGGVAYMAHVGGFVFGAAAAYGIQRLHVESRWVNTRIESKITTTHVEKPSLERAMAARAAGDASAAFDLLVKENMRAPHDRDVALALWDVAVELGRGADAASALEMVIRLDLKSAEPRLALAHWDELRTNAPEARLEPTVLVRIAQVLSQSGDAAEAVRVLRAVMDSSGARIGPELAFRIGHLVRDLDVELAREALCAALARPGIDPELRARSESLLAELNGPRPIVPVGSEFTRP